MLPIKPSLEKTEFTPGSAVEIKLINTGILCIINLVREPVNINYDFKGAKNSEKNSNVFIGSSHEPCPGRLRG